MEDKYTFISFTVIASILNILLLIMLVTGLNFYISNIRNYQLNETLNQELSSITNEFKIKTSTQVKDSTQLKARFNSTTSISGYLEQLVFKTNEKNVQVYKSSVLNTSETEITMEIILYGSFESVGRVIKEIENELPLTEITESSIEISGNFIKNKLILKILIDKND
jgi:hypothetical protein